MVFLCIAGITTEASRLLIPENGTKEEEKSHAPICEISTPHFPLKKWSAACVCSIIPMRLDLFLSLVAASSSSYTDRPQSLAMSCEIFLFLLHGKEFKVRPRSNAQLPPPTVRSTEIISLFLTWYVDNKNIDEIRTLVDKTKSLFSKKNNYICHTVF